jgi:hypothetical protein
MAELRLNLDGEVQGLEFAGINTLTLDDDTQLGAAGNLGNIGTGWIIVGVVAAGLLTWGIIEWADDDDSSSSP